MTIYRIIIKRNEIGVFPRISMFFNTLPTVSQLKDEIQKKIDSIEDPFFKEMFESFLNTNFLHYYTHTLALENSLFGVVKYDENPFTSVELHRIDVTEL